MARAITGRWSGCDPTLAPMSAGVEMTGDGVPSGDSVISTRDLRKSFRGRRGSAVEAVRGVSIDVKRGEIFGFLGPNGAGKTTTLRMLTTLLPIDGGSATVAGFDVRSAPDWVRSRIGYVSQLGGSDDLATGRENLVLQGRLYGDEVGAGKRRAGGGGSAWRSGSPRGPRCCSSTSRAAGLTRRTAPTSGSTSVRCASAAR